MKSFNLGAFLRAVFTQAKADIRPTFVSTGLVGLLVGPAAILGITYFALTDQPQLRAIAAISIVAAIAGLVIMQISAEIYQERVSGTLLRVRTLPHGPLSWAIGKSISALFVMVLSQVLILVGFYVLFPALEFTALELLAMAVLLPAVAAAHVPLGFILGTLFRSTGLTIVIYLFAMALVSTSGAFFPITLLPRAVQYLHLVFPSYWSAHLARYVFGLSTPEWEVGGSAQPLLAIAVLAVWIVAGYAASAFMIKRSFRKESIGSLASIQGAIRSQVGL